MFSVSMENVLELARVTDRPLTTMFCKQAVLDHLTKTSLMHLKQRIQIYTYVISVFFDLQCLRAANLLLL